MDIVFRSFPLSDFDPLLLFLHLCPVGPGFLESATQAPRTGRYSIVPLRRTESYRLDDRGLARVDGGAERFLPGDPLEILGEVLAARGVPKKPGMPLFPGGFFGYLAYELAGCIEELPRLGRVEPRVPLLWLDWVDLTAVYDHRERMLTLASLDPEEDLAALEREARQALQQRLPPCGGGAGRLPEPVIAPGAFQSMVRKAREYIAAGDIYQANLSCRFDGEFFGTAAELYRRLRRVNPSPFGGLLRSPGWRSSPLLRSGSSRCTTASQKPAPSPAPGPGALPHPGTPAWGRNSSGIPRSGPSTSCSSTWSAMTSARSAGWGPWRWTS